MTRRPTDPPMLSSSGEEYLRLANAPVDTASRPDDYSAAGGNDTVAELAHHVDGLASDLIELSHSLYAQPECGFEEFESVRKVAELLTKHGHTPTVGVYGLETAVEARVSSGEGPTIVIMAEYDALPGIGHGCGHNVICASGVGAFLAAAPLVERFGGTLVLQGTPAEENGGGKAIMMDHGCLDGVDAAMMVHPFGGNSYLTSAYLGLRDVKVSYRGLSAHAAAMPFMGVNALDAAVAAYNGAAALRQQMVPSDRIHGTFVDVPPRRTSSPTRRGCCTTCVQPR